MGLGKKTTKHISVIIKHHIKTLKLTHVEWGRVSGREDVAAQTLRGVHTASLGGVASTPADCTVTKEGGRGVGAKTALSWSLYPLVQ